MDWTVHDAVRQAVERFYRKAVSKDAINIPKYDLFVTEIRKDWEKAGFDLTDERDLFRLWGALSITLAGTAYMLQECETQEEIKGAVTVLGVYGNMTGLFLREMSKDIAPPVPEEKAPDA